MVHHVQKRLASTAAKLVSVSASSLSKFPPKEALFQRTELPKPFSPETWASLQPPPTSALSAFAHRIGLTSVLDSPEIIQQACTHESFGPFYKSHYPNHHDPKTNAQLAPLGNALMGLFAAEHLHASYPYLPTRVLKAAVTAHVGPLTCASISQEMGAGPLLRWHRAPPTPARPPILHTDALASIPRSITAILYQKRSILSARQFVHSYFLTREIDLRGMIKFFNPKKALLEAVHKFGRERPKSRLLKETGRYTNSPIFVVGIFSGGDKLGEGFGSSLKMAEYRAAEDALLRLFLTKRPTEQLQLPTATFPAGLGNIFQKGQAGSYIAPELVEAEVMYASSGKSGVVKPRREDADYI
ncbi:hypothetical protein EYR38_008824 [Pleurotus pulmonarius]|nr:hypothetical protein EYR38_008824 [Pleurotus pulmonarius]